MSLKTKLNDEMLRYQMLQEIAAEKPEKTFILI